MGTTDIALRRVFEQLIEGNAGLAIMEAVAYLASWPNPQTQERLEVLKDEYRLMEDYWAKGVNDPQLLEQYQRLLQRTYVLCANMAIHRHLQSSSYLQNLSRQVRTAGAQWSLSAIRKEMESFVADVAMLELEPEAQRRQKSLDLHQRHRQQMNALFNYIVTSRIWTDGVGEAMQDMLLSPTIDSIDQQLMVTGITLSLMNRFDWVKFRLLTNVYQQSQEEEVRQRALVGWVMGIDDDFLSVYPEQRELVGRLLQSKRTCRELTELQMQLIYTMDAEKDTSTIREEIMPDIMSNSQFRITPDGIEEAEDDALEDVLHPDAAEQRMEKLEASFQRMIDMQRQGSDIYFGGFSQMKRFPFFYDMSNWLVPFYLQHPDIASYMERLEDNSTLCTLLEKGPFCNSDKYSLVMVMQQVVDKLPESVRKMMQQGEAQLDAIEQSDQRQPAYVRRVYLMDLYRFFKLFPNRAALCNPFDAVENELGMCLFFSSQLFSGTPAEEQKRAVVPVLLKRGFRHAAEQLLDSFADDMRDVQYCLWKKDYDAALALEPDNERALRGHARVMFGRNDLEQALDDYEHLLMLRPGNTLYMLNKAVCLLAMKDYESAQQVLFQLNYEQPDNVQVNRTLAWTLTCDGKLEQAERLYGQILADAGTTSEDMLYHGYCLWLQGRRQEAAKSFQNYMEEEKMDADDFSFKEKDLLRHFGIGDIDIKLMQGLVLS